MKSGTVRTVKGTVKASERLLSDSGVVLYKIPDGWVSDINNAIEVLEYPEAQFLLKVTASSGTKVLGGGELNKGEIVEAFRYQHFRFELHDGWVNEHDVTILRGNVDQIMIRNISAK